MITFGEFIQMKNKDLHGSDIRKTEPAGLRSIIECIKENQRFIISLDKKKLIESFLKKLLEKTNGNDFGNKDNKKHKS